MTAKGSCFSIVQEQMRGVVVGERRDSRAGGDCLLASADGVSSTASSAVGEREWPWPSMLFGASVRVCGCLLSVQQAAQTVGRLSDVHVEHA